MNKGRDTKRSCDESGRWCRGVDGIDTALKAVALLKEAVHEWRLRWKPMQRECSPFEGTQERIRDTTSSVLNWDTLKVLVNGFCFFISYAN